MSAALVLALASAATAQVRVGVIGNGQMSWQGVVDQLNNDSFFDFTAVRITPAQAENLNDLLTNYDALVLGDAGFNDDGYTANMFTAVRGFLDAGRGVVTTGFYVYSNTVSGNPDYITPANTQSSYAYRANDALSIIDGNHPVTMGVGNIGPTGAAGETPNAGPDGNAATIANLGNGAGVIVQDALAGRSVYLGWAYLGASNYGSANLRSGAPDQLFEQAVYWASGIPSPGAAALLGLGGLAAARRRRA